MKAKMISVIAAGVAVSVAAAAEREAAPQQVEGVPNVPNLPNVQPRQLQGVQRQQQLRVGGGVEGVPEALPEFDRDENGELEKGKPLIQIALLLDTSSSMDGLINQARERLWGIVNEFIEAERDGEDPIFQVALYEYGKSSLKAEDAWVRKIVPLTVDLDKVSEELFALNTAGGEEYCGWVIGRSLRELGWSEKEGDLRVIFIAGNEPFTQGPVDAAGQCAEAKRADIVVNTVHCGRHENGIAGGWKAGADEGGGAYVSIDQDEVLAHVEAPQDAELAELNGALNGTYVAFGRAGEEAKERQLAQDKNALQAGVGVLSMRASSKSGKYYSNAHWDLVDWSKEEGNDLGSVKAEELPEALRGMDVEGRKKYVAEMAGKRTELQGRIKELSAERARFVAEVRKKQAEEAGGKGLDDAIIESLKEEAVKRGFSLKGKG